MTTTTTTTTTKKMTTMTYNMVDTPLLASKMRYLRKITLTTSMINKDDDNEKYICKSRQKQYKVEEDDAGATTTTTTTTMTIGVETRRPRGSGSKLATRYDEEQQKNDIR